MPFTIYFTFKISFLDLAIQQILVEFPSRIPYHVYIEIHSIVAHVQCSAAIHTKDSVILISNGFPVFLSNDGGTSADR